jgi:GNAT superfamily N-acetyltransferase
MPVVVRPLRPEDRPAWALLWQGYLSFYKADLSAEVTEAAWARIHDPREPVHGLCAEVDGAVLGIVHFVFYRTTWSLADRCYLHDLFTAEQARGQGLGRRLIEAVYEQAKDRGAEAVWWLTQESNATARGLYERVAKRTGFIQYRQTL